MKVVAATRGIPHHRHAPVCPQVVFGDLVDAAHGSSRLATSLSARGVEVWAILASIINTTKLHELDPQAYLADVLEKMVSRQTKMNSLHELLPWARKAARAQQMEVAA